MELEQVVNPEEIVSPPGEVVSPEQVAEQETPAEGPAPSEEMDQEIAALQAAIDAAKTPEDKQAQQGKLNAAFARIRRERKEAKQAELEALKEAAYQRGRAEAVVKPVVETKPPVEEPIVIPDFIKPAPRREDFDEYEGETDYREAREAWLVEKAEHNAIHRAKAEIAAEQKRQEQAKRQVETSQWAQKGVEKFPDFMETIASHANTIPPVMAQAVTEAENSHEIAYFLGKNPKEYSRIAALSPVKQAIEIGKIDTKIAQTPIKTTSKAPAPIAPVKGGAPPVAKTLEQLAEEDPGAYIEAMNKKEFQGK